MPTVMMVTSSKYQYFFTKLISSPCAVGKHFSLYDKVHYSFRYGVGERPFIARVLCGCFCPASTVYSEACFGGCKISFDCEYHSISDTKGTQISDLRAILVDFDVLTHRGGRRRGGGGRRRSIIITSVVTGVISACTTAD